ncbi:pre-mRNA-splicing factor SYF2 [Hydra vulgaris]|nr:pre-mRNA-splicing factor SYF2 [Hydra vulgaris]XP_047124095.1 pre-mRNA-splicing factor SYF2 [Hydra vulgaris]XP_047124096.1 pre-mRNA-splicing factor SYF2 [Hydra vulgaris]
MISTDDCCIWPTIEDSDSSESECELKKQNTDDNNLCGITEDEINGDFPQLPQFQHCENSDSEDEILNKEDTKKKNPYLAHMSGVKKYENRLRELHLKRNEARKLNHQEVAAEDQQKKLPKNFEARRKRAEWELNDKAARQSALENGENYDEIKLLEETADDIDRFERKKRKKNNQDPGFIDYATSQLRQYDRLTKQMKPNLETYQQTKKKMGDSIFPGAHNLMYGGKNRPSEEAIDRMVGDLEQQIAKRSKYHRRRQHHEDADVDYINEKNMKFNQKAERYYGQYTREIKDNLERGTAI